MSTSSCAPTEPDDSSLSSLNYTVDRKESNARLMMEFVESREVAQNYCDLITFFPDRPVESLMNPASVAGLSTAPSAQKRRLINVIASNNVAAAPTKQETDRDHGASAIPEEGVQGSRGSRATLFVFKLCTPKQK